MRAGVYPVIFIDAIVITIRDGQVTNRPVDTAIGASPWSRWTRFASGRAGWGESRQLALGSAVSPMRSAASFARGITVLLTARNPRAGTRNSQRMTVPAEGEVDDDGTSLAQHELPQRWNGEGCDVVLLGHHATPVSCP